MDGTKANVELMADGKKLKARAIRKLIKSRQVGRVLVGVGGWYSRAHVFEEITLNF